MLSTHTLICFETMCYVEEKDDTKPNVQIRKLTPSMVRLRFTFGYGISLGRFRKRFRNLKR